MTEVHLTIQRTLATAIISDIILTLQIVEYRSFRGILTVKARGRVEILMDKNVFSVRINWLVWGTSGFTLTRAYGVAYYMI